MGSTDVECFKNTTLEDEQIWTYQITHEKKGTWSEANLPMIMFHVNLPGVFLALIFKIGYRLWTCFPEMIGNWKIGVDVFTFQIKAILEISWNHDCWRKGQVNWEKRTGSILGYLPFDIGIYFFETLFEVFQAIHHHALSHMEIWFPVVFSFLFTKTHMPQNFTTTTNRVILQRSLFVLWKKDPYDLSITGHTSIFEEPTKNSMIIQTEHMFFF